MRYLASRGSISQLEPLEQWSLSIDNVISPSAAMISRGSSCGTARTSARAQNPVTRLSRTPRAQMKYGRNL